MARRTRRRTVRGLRTSWSAFHPRAPVPGPPPAIPPRARSRAGYGPRIPPRSSRQTRNRVLTVIAESFEKGVTYTEPKVNAICGSWFDGWVSLRRALIDEGLLHRDAAARYERA
ncbi:DUF2087 domain-containing protein [Streptomyces olivaceiscleroticus]|uniref:DUF2087 domain-containing protein n=1 Tax=Streptomyces olivaceiscleroticus TaxID=68245 RepID=A0ABN0ZIL8_9ACTN